jgi:hypothetical protein
MARAEFEITPEGRIRHNFKLIPFTIVTKQDGCAVRMPASVVETILMHRIPHLEGRYHCQSVAAITV